MTILVYWKILEVFVGGGMALIHVPVVVICCILMALVFAHLPTSVVLRCIACFFVACLTANAHYFGMTPVSHRSNPRGWTWQFLPLGQSNVSAEACVIVSLFCDVMLMASNSLLVFKLEEPLFPKPTLEGIAPRVLQDQQIHSHKSGQLRFVFIE